MIAQIITLFFPSGDVALKWLTCAQQQFLELCFFLDHFFLLSALNWFIYVDFDV